MTLSLITAFLAQIGFGDPWVVKTLKFFQSKHIEGVRILAPSAIHLGNYHLQKKIILEIFYVERQWSNYVRN